MRSMFVCQQQFYAISNVLLERVQSMQRSITEHQFSVVRKRRDRQS